MATESTGRTKWVDELTSIMLQQELICRRLLELSTEDRVAVLSGRADDLEHSTREKVSLIAEMEQREQARRGAARHLAVELELPGDPSLVEIAGRMDGEASEELLEIRHRLVDLAGKLRESNESNLLLMRRSLASIRDSLRQVRHSILPGDVYTNNGLPAMGVVGSAALDLHA